MHLIDPLRIAIRLVCLVCPILLGLSSARAQTAACCLGDQCQELEPTACEDAGGDWLGGLDPRVADCSTTPCSTGACCLGVGCSDHYAGDPLAAERCEGWNGVYHGGVTCDLTCLTNDRCQYATSVCDDLMHDPDIGQCDNDDALDPGPVCSISSQDCYDGSPCVPWPLDAYRCFVPTDNRGASTDGPLSAGDCLASGLNSFKKDVWYRIVAPCRGEMVIDMCNAEGQYDSMLAVFGDGSADPPCPGDSNEDLLACNDDFCAPNTATSALQTEVVAGAGYLIRVGSWDSFNEGPTGVSELNIGFLCDPWPYPLRLPSGAKHQARKHRYLSINPNVNPLAPTVIKVVVEEMRVCQNDPRRSCLSDDGTGSADSECRNVCEDDPTILCPNGMSDCPSGPCIDSGPCVDGTPNPPIEWIVRQAPEQILLGCKKPGCDNTVENCCTDEDWVARLGNIPYVDANNWQDFDMIHIGDCGIIPSVTYAVYACNPQNLNDCSVPLLVGTQQSPRFTQMHFGDIAGAALVPGILEPPDGSTNVIDIGAWTFTLQNYGTPETLKVHPTMADLRGGFAGTPPNYILGLEDLDAILKFGINAQPWDREGEVGAIGVSPGSCPDCLNPAACPP